jgi:hypothetical protein
MGMLRRGCIEIWVFLGKSVMIDGIFVMIHGFFWYGSALTHEILLGFILRMKYGVPELHLVIENSRVELVI